MSKSKFFNINNSIFNKEKVVAVHQQTETVEVVKTVAVIFIETAEGINEHRVFLPEGKQVSDFIKSDDLNYLDN